MANDFDDYFIPAADIGEVREFGTLAPTSWLPLLGGFYNTTVYSKLFDRIGHSALLGSQVTFGTPTITWPDGSGLSVAFALGQYLAYGTSSGTNQYLYINKAAAYGASGWTNIFVLVPGSRQISRFSELAVNPANTIGALIGYQSGYTTSLFTFDLTAVQVADLPSSGAVVRRFVVKADKIAASVRGSGTIYTRATAVSATAMVGVNVPTQSGVTFTGQGVISLNPATGKLHALDTNGYIFTCAAAADPAVGANWVLEPVRIGDTGGSITAKDLEFDSLGNAYAYTQTGVWYCDAADNLGNWVQIAKFSSITTQEGRITRLANGLVALAPLNRYAFRGVVGDVGNNLLGGADNVSYGWDGSKILMGSSATSSGNLLALVPAYNLSTTFRLPNHADAADPTGRPRKHIKAR